MINKKYERSMFDVHILKQLSSYAPTHLRLAQDEKIIQTFSHVYKRSQIISFKQKSAARYTHAASSGS
jgi:hypothetical protein